MQKLWFEIIWWLLTLFVLSVSVLFPPSTATGWVVVAGLAGLIWAGIGFILTRRSCKSKQKLVKTVLP
jgi:Flp pilus assembly protein TadB